MFIHTHSTSSASCMWQILAEHATLKIVIANQPLCLCRLEAATFSKSNPASPPFAMYDISSGEPPAQPRHGTCCRVIWCAPVASP